MQIWPFGQAAPGQHAPDTQPPLQHTRPAPHIPSEVHAWQAFCRHKSGAGHWASSQHSPDTQTLLQHTPPRPHWELEEHGVWTPDIKSAGLRQRPSSQKRMGPQSPPGPHGGVRAAAASCTWPQSGWHAPVEHEPLQQLWPGPQSASAPHAPQWRLLQTWPGAQSSEEQHEPATHRPPQHVLPDPQSLAAVQA